MPKPKKNIKSTKVALKFSNTEKINQLHKILDEGKVVLSQFVDILWDLEKVPKFLNKEIIHQVESWLSYRMLQCIGKQASGIVRGTRQKQDKRLHVITKLLSEGQPRKAKKLQQIYDKAKVSKPIIDNIELDISERIVSINLENNTSFDGWLTFTSIGEKIKLTIPFQKTKHFNELRSKGNLRKGIRLSKENTTFSFEMFGTPKKEKGSILGIDIGQTTLLSCSDNQVSKKDIHGHDLDSINSKLTKKKKGSNGFQRTVSHRKDYINWSIKQLDITNIKQVNLENIKYLRKGRRSSRKLSHWTYTDIFEKLESYCEEQGVLVNKINPTYSSQRCSECGWTRKSNRKGKLFKCGKCGFTTDSDLNASKNIALPDLPAIRKSIRLEHPNKKGFFWQCSGQEPMVPVVQRSIIDDKCL